MKQSQALKQTSLQIATCNNCRKEFDILTNIKRIYKAKIIDIGLACPHCQTFFHSYYLNKNLVKKQKALKNFRTNPKLFKTKQSRYTKLFNAFQEKYKGV